MSDITLHVRDFRPPEIETAAEGGDVRLDSQLANLDPVTGAIIVGAALAAGQFLIRLWREFRGGTVIDLTRTPIEVSRDRDLDYGYFLIIAKDGSVSVDGKDEPETALERMVTGALELATKAGVDGLKALIAAQLGPDAKTTVKPA